MDLKLIKIKIIFPYSIELINRKVLNVFLDAPDNLDIKVNQNEDKWSITCSSNGNPDPHMTLKSEKGVVAQGAYLSTASILISLNENC